MLITTGQHHLALYNKWKMIGR